MKNVRAEGRDPMDYDVHHEFPLAEMVAAFLNERGIGFDDVALKGNQAEGYCEELADTSLTAKWQEYHHTHARLRVLPKREHQMIPTRTKPSKQPAANR